ncbi:MAG TPA: hypothetical protein VIV60_32825 [Polyangiaceae bacterium]
MPLKRRTLRPVCRPAAALLTLALSLPVAGCGSTLMKQHVEANAKQWHLVVREVQDGPNSMPVQNFRYEPESGERFLHVWVTLRNDASQKRKWNWPRCGLDHGDKEYIPTLVLFDLMVNAPAEQEQELDPSETIERRVIFTYPDAGPLPTRLRCGELDVPLQLVK